MRLLIGGDFCPIGRAEKLLAAGKMIFDESLRDEIAAADYFVANLECPLTDNSRAIMKSGPHLRATKKISVGLGSLGVNCFSLANNHIMDFGKDGLVDTVEALDSSGISHFGYKVDGRGKSTILIERAGRKVAILAFSNLEFSLFYDHCGTGVFPIDVIDILKEIETVRRHVDHFVVLLHTGLFNYPLPFPSQRKLCRYLVEVGASAVLCQHSHTCGAYEHYRSGFISYGQGSLVFDMNRPGSNWESGYLVALDLSSSLVEASIIGVKQFGREPNVRLQTPDEQQMLVSSLERFNAALNDEAIFDFHLDEYVRKGTRSYYGNMLLPSNKWTRRVARRVDLGKLVPRKLKLVWLNLWRNPEHAEAIVQMLRRELYGK